jgi:hypothetical protein
VHLAGLGPAWAVLPAVVIYFSAAWPNRHRGLEPGPLYLPGQRQRRLADARRCTRHQRSQAIEVAGKYSGFCFVQTGLFTKTKTGIGL